jgi:hypothetical protein
MKKSPMRLLLLVLSVIALALALAPASFAGEDEDPGPTQAGEVQAPSSGGSGPASLQGPASTESQQTAGSTEVLGVSQTSNGTATTKTADVVKAQGGIQAGFGGMAMSSGSLPFAGIAGVLFILAGAAIFVPARVRSHG